MPKANDYDIQLHKRLLDREETASSELCLFFLDRLINHFKPIYSRNPECDEAMINDAVTESLLKFIDDPSKFNSELGSLENYLKMSTEGDIKNLLDKKRRKLRSSPVFSW